MNKSISLCAWAGQLAMFLMFMAMWPAWDILPPPSPSIPLEEWANHFRDNTVGVLVGSAIMMLGASLFLIFGGGLCACLMRMEGKQFPLTIGMIMIFPFGFFPLFAMLVFFVETVFRPDLSSEMIGVLADLGLFMLAIPGLVAMVQFVITGFIILRDVNAEPIFPRWVAYVNIWVGILSIPGCLVPFFKTGPFAWNGIIAFWIPAIAFGILINVLFFAMRKAANHSALQAA
jgi:hypothetical protein